MKTLDTLLTNISKVIIDPLIVLMFAIALLVFVFGVVEYLIKATRGADDLKEAKSHLLYGILGMFIMAGVKGIVVILENLIK